MFYCQNKARVEAERQRQLLSLDVYEHGACSLGVDVHVIPHNMWVRRTAECCPAGALSTRRRRDGMRAHLPAFMLKSARTTPAEPQRDTGEAPVRNLGDAWLMGRADIEGAGHKKLAHGVSNRIKAATRSPPLGIS